MDYYNLDENNNAVPCTLIEWGVMYQTEEGNDRRRVAEDWIDGYHISTVFLGMDHGFYPGQIHLFETMIFGQGNGDGYQDRCETWKEAEEMHEKAVQWVKDGCKDE